MATETFQGARLSALIEVKHLLCAQLSGDHIHGTIECAQ